MSGMFVLTGGPGTGKSTLIDELRSNGVACCSEVSRTIIAESNRYGSDLLPWKNLQAFADECFRQMKQQLAEAQELEVCFFDRGIPDIIAYLMYGGLKPRTELYESGHGYEKLVFVAPPWAEIFVNDAERPQSFKDCQNLHNLLLETYSNLGYKVVMLPKASVEDRRKFVMKTIIDYYTRR